MKSKKVELELIEKYLNAFFAIKFSFPKLKIEKLLSKLNVLKIFYLVNKFIKSPGKKLTRSEKPKLLKRITILGL